jgi:hypothetical protein
MKRWLKEVGLESMLDSPEHKVALKRLVSSGPTVARRSLIDAELETRLSDLGDRKLLAMAIVDEFYAYYMFKKSAPWERYAFTLVLLMYDLPPVLQVAELMGTTVRRRFRTTRSGAVVPCWVIQTSGYRAYKIIQLVRPYLVGQKAHQADVALRTGPLAGFRVSLEKDIYRKGLLLSAANLPKKMPASRLRESSRTSLAPRRHAV